MKCHISLCFAVILSLTITRAVTTSEITSELPKNKTTELEAPIAKGAEVTEEIPAIAVEEAQESKQADRAKKSTTTFCVEIRPSPSEAPIRICDNQPPSAPIRQQPQFSPFFQEQRPLFAPSGNYVQEDDDSVVIEAPSVPEYFAPNEPYPPQNSYPYYPQYSEFFNQETYPQQYSVIPSAVADNYPQADYPQVPQQYSIPSGFSNNYPQAEIPQVPQQYSISSVPSNNYPQVPQQYSIASVSSNNYPQADHPQVPQQYSIASVSSNNYPQADHPQVPQQYSIASVSSNYYPQADSHQVPQQYSIASVSSNDYSQVDSPQVPQQYSIASVSSNDYPQADVPQVPQQYSIASVSSNDYPQADLPETPQQHFIIPSTVSNNYPQVPQQYFVPSIDSNNYPQDPPAQQYTIPASVSNPYPQFYCPPSPCSSSGSGFSQASQRVYTAPTFGMDYVATIPLEMKTNQYFGSEITEAPFVKTHVQDLYGVPSSSYPSNFYNHGYHYVMRNDPQVLSAGESSDGAHFGQPMVVATQTNTDVSQQEQHTVAQSSIQPQISIDDGYQSHSTIPTVVQHTPHQSYQHSPDPYPITHHSEHSGYPVDSQQSIVVQPSISVNSESGIIPRGSDNAHQETQQFENESSEESSEEKKELGVSVPAMTPSQMLNAMRKNGGSSSFHKTMQSFPRVNDNRSNSNGFARAPCDGKPFMIAGSKRSITDKNSKIGEGGATTHEMGKREAKKASGKKTH